MITEYILRNQQVWNLSQLIFGDNKQKSQLYRSLVSKKGKLLDFGCANGNTFLAFKDYDYTGIDIDRKVISYAQKKYSRYPKAKFICANILENTLSKAHFDSVLFAGTGHHIPNREVFKIMQSLARVMKKDGKLYFVDMIKDKSRSSLLLNFIMSLDQGKFHKDQSFYLANLKKFSKSLIPLKHKTLQIQSTFMPQPTYFVAIFKKV